MRTWAVAMLSVLALAGCGSDDGRASDDPTPSGTPASGGLGSDAVVALTGAQICDGVSTAAVSEAIVSEVVSAEPGTTDTAQCAYTYGGDSSTLSNVTVASMAPDDVGDRGLEDAFAYVVDLNSAPASGTEPVEVDAGDRAVRLSGESLHLGVVATGGHLLTVIATPDVTAAQVDALLRSVGSAFA